MLKIIPLVVICFLSIQSNAQHVSNKNSAFFYWGYNRSLYSTSNIHFNSNEYDVTFYKVKASDRPSPIGKVYLDPTRLSIPQYNIRLGYYITDRVSISIGSDHMKYVVDGGQEVQMSGFIASTTSPSYNGVHFHEKVKLTNDLLQFEHTDGLNLLTLETDYAQPLLRIKKFRVNALTGLGGIWVITRSDVRILNDGINNNFHLSGYSLTGKLGFRFEYGNCLFFTTETKGGYMSLPDVLIHNEEQKRADHNFYFLEYYGALGFRYPLRKVSKFIHKLQSHSHS